MCFAISPFPVIQIKCKMQGALYCVFILLNKSVCNRECRVIEMLLIKWNPNSSGIEEMFTQDLAKHYLRIQGSDKTLKSRHMCPSNLSLFFIYLQSFWFHVFFFNIKYIFVSLKFFIFFIK